MLKNAPTLAIGGLDTAESEPRQVCWTVRLASRDLGSIAALLSRVITRLYEGNPPDHIVFLKTSRRDKAISELLRNVSANSNAFLL